MKKVLDGSVRIDKEYVLSPEEVEFYKLLAEDYTIIDAAEATLVSKRTSEARMYALQSHLGLRTRHGLIAYLLRKKII